MKDEVRRRRQAIRWYRQGVPFGNICDRIGRSATWLAKWISRFEAERWSGLQDRSRRPHRLRAVTPDAIVRRVLALRSELEARHARNGGVGAGAIQRKLQREVSSVPSISTIERILRRYRSARETSRIA